MNEEAKKLELVGDGLLLAVARLYLHNRHAELPYMLYSRLTAYMVNNKTLARIAEGEGIKGLTEGWDSRADAFEVEIARHFYRHGWVSVRLWLWNLFDRYLDIEAEARRLTDPTVTDKLMRQVRGALNYTMKIQGGRITPASVETAAARIVEHLQSSNGLS